MSSHRTEPNNLQISRLVSLLSTFFHDKDEGLTQKRLRCALISVSDYLNLSAEEFFELPVADDLREHNVKVLQPRVRLARRKAAFAVRSA